MDEETRKYIEDGKLLMNNSRLDRKEALMTLKEFVEEETAKCVWCGEEFPVSELHREKDMGYLCDHCKKGIESRGEELEFEDEYDESLNEETYNYSNYKYLQEPVDTYRGFDILKMDISKIIYDDGKEYPGFERYLVAYHGKFFPDEVYAHHDMNKIEDAKEVIDKIIAENPKYRIKESASDDYNKFHNREDIQYTGTEEFEVLDKLRSKYGCKFGARGIGRIEVIGDKADRVEKDFGYYQFNGELPESLKKESVDDKNISHIYLVHSEDGDTLYKTWGLEDAIDWANDQNASLGFNNAVSVEEYVCDDKDEIDFYSPSVTVWEADDSIYESVDDHMEYSAFGSMSAKDHAEAIAQYDAVMDNGLSSYDDFVKRFTENDTVFSKNIAKSMYTVYKEKFKTWSDLNDRFPNQIRLGDFDIRRFNDDISKSKNK